MKAKKIEAEGSELILRNEHGDYAIIPKKHRLEVQDMVKSGCHGCIDALVDTLPVMNDYAQDGSLYPEEPVINPNNPIQLKEVTIKAEAPTWVKYKQAWEKENPFDINKYVEDRFNNPVGREAIKRIDEKGWKETLKQEGLKKRERELDEATKMGLLYQRFNPQGKDDIAIADEQFSKRYGTSTHRYRYDNDPKYRKYYENVARNATSKIDYPSTDLRRKDVVAPNNMWMYPNLTGKSKKAMTDFSNELIATALPIPGLEAMGKIPSVFKAGSNLVKGVDKIDDVTKVVSKEKQLRKLDEIANNQLPEPPHEIILNQPSNMIENINLTRQSAKNKKIIPSFDDVDLGNDLTLRRNPSRVLNKEDILGKHNALISVKNKKTNEYIDLKSWKDTDGEIYYYMSANMPSSKIKAGKAYLELEKHIPKGSSILENSSLSMDSYSNIIKQLKNPKFESSVKGKIQLNNMGVNNKVPNANNQSMFASSDRVLFDNINEANISVSELNKLLKANNLPEATITKDYISFQPQAHLPYEKRVIYGIELPNIALKKLYTILGLGTTGGLSYKSQQSNKTE